MQAQGCFVEMYLQLKQTGYRQYLKASKICCLVCFWEVSLECTSEASSLCF